MMRSFYDGMEGIKNHQIWLDVIGNNVTNVNTYGFKSSRVTFETVFSDVLSMATAPRGKLGGINPKEIGLGATIATIQTLHTKGNAEQTNKKTDLAIDGDGYFILRDGYTERKYYTRAGTFDFDAGGYYVDLSNGFQVQGWGAERDEVTGHLILDPITGRTSIDTSKSLGGMQVTLGEHLAPKQTENIKLYSNLNAESPFAVNQIHTSFKKGIESVVGVSGSSINTAATWDRAGFAQAPNGTITINGFTFSLDAYTTPQDLMTAINQQESVGVEIVYNAGLDLFRITPKDYWTDISLSENPKAPGQGFFTQAKIAASKSKDVPYTYNTGNENKIVFTHLFEPTRKDKVYVAWKVVDPETFEPIETNSYYYSANTKMSGPGTLGANANCYSFPHGTVDPSTVAVMVDGIVRPTTDYTFLNNQGPNGVDAIRFTANIPSASDLVTTSYYYNKTVKAEGVLELNDKGRVINNYINTETFPEITSTSEVSPGAGVVNLTITANPWQAPNFRAAVDGTITIATSVGSFTSNAISTYPNVQALMNAINASVADVTITYDVSTDKFTLRSDAPGDMTLSQTGTFGFFSAVNIPVGSVSGGNNNSVLDLTSEIPTGADGWRETTGIAGSGKDFYRVNTDRSSFSESSTTTLAGMPTADTYDLFYPDVDWTSMQIHVVITSGANAGASAMATVDAAAGSNFRFLDNTGPFGVDRIIYNSMPTQGTDRLGNVIANFNTIATTNNSQIVLEYRRSRANSVDIFVPNGNYGPEPIVFSPNTLKPVYESGELANVADAAVEGTAEMNERRGDKGYEYGISMEIFDSEGVAHMLLIYLERIKEKTWLWWTPNPIEGGKVAGYGLATFNQDAVYEPSTSIVFESPSDPSPEGSRYRGIYFNPPEDPSDTRGAPPPTEGAAIVKILTDFSQVMEAGGTSTTDIVEQDGYPMGELQSVTIDNRGVLVGQYSNYRSLDLAQIALATFTNPSGLSNLGGTMFEETANSGKADIGSPSTKRRGGIKSGYLEMSNVDLTEEFLKMILAERGFQANSRSVTTADRIIMELLRMRP